MITIRKQTTDKVCEIEISGHSGYGPRGYDIVCSAVSSLLLTLDKRLSVLLSAEYEADIKEGYAHIKAKADGNKLCGQDIDFFLSGCRLLADSFPECVTVIDCNPL